MVKLQIGKATLSIDSNEPDKHGTATWSGEYQELATWLPRQYGMFGHPVGGIPAPMDAIAAFKMTGKKYRVVKGQEILDLPLKPLPEGAVS